jgi:transcriptional regulator with XRE-family HTH domain
MNPDLAQLPVKPALAAPSAEGLPLILRKARLAQRLSQLELSLRLEVSQRHISYVESARAKPSRELLIAWLEVLALPFVERNVAMLRAGFAPIFSETRLDDPALAQANETLVYLLSTHDPMPCYVLDADWNLLQSNQGGKWLASVLMPWLADRPEGTPVNMLDVLGHPEGFTKHLVNLDEVGPKFLAHMKSGAAVREALKPKVAKFAALLEQRLGRSTAHTSAHTTAHTIANAPAHATSIGSTPLLTSRFSSPFGELAFFSMFTTFGRPQDITLASLVIEHLFAADEATRRVLSAQVKISSIKPGA